MKETEGKLRSRGLVWDDVKIIKTDSGAGFNIEDFKEFAKDINYDSGFGTPVISDSLIIAGDTWWFERVDYDGLEGWRFRSMPDLDILVKGKKKDLLY